MYCDWWCKNTTSIYQLGTPFSGFLTHIDDLYWKGTTYYSHPPMKTQVLLTQMLFPTLSNTSFSLEPLLKILQGTKVLQNFIEKCNCTLIEGVTWCKSNCNFTLLKFAVWYWNTFLNKCGYVIHHFNVHFPLYVFFFFANDVLFAAYFIFILDYGNDVRQKANSSDFLIWVQNGL